MLPIIFLVTVAFTAEDVYVLDTVVVNAARYPMDLKDIALATLLIDRAEIEKQNASTIGEILSKKAGIDIKDYGSGMVSSISIRGIQASGVLVLVDGQPLNSPLTGIADLGLIDINSVERIEIIKGPASSLYGANGIGGMVNIITEGNTQDIGGGARAASSTSKISEPFQATDYCMRYQVPLGPFSYLLEGAQSKNPGIRTNSYLTSINIKNRIAYVNKNLKILAQLGLTGRDYGVPGPMPLIDSLNPMPLYGDSTATSKSDYQIDRMLSGRISLDYMLTKNLSLRACANDLMQQQRFHTKFFSIQETSEDYIYDLNTFNTSISALFFTDHQQFAIGYDHCRDTLRATKLSVQTGDQIWSAANRTQSIWISGSWHALGMLTFNPSCRYDKNSNYGDFLSPHFGLTIKPASRYWIKLSLGRAFRAPGLNDLYWPIYGNQDLKPEYGNAYEIRLESSPVNGLFAALSLFMRDIKDRITWLPGKDGLWKPQNINLLSVKGMETEIRHKLNDRISIDLDFTFLSANQTNQELFYSYYDWLADTTHNESAMVTREAAFTPRGEVSVTLDLMLPGDFLMMLSDSYTASRKNYYENWTGYPAISRDTKILAGHNIMNLAITGQLFARLHFSAGIKNLFDVNYATQFGNSTSDLDYPMPGRTYTLQLKFR